MTNPVQPLLHGETVVLRAPAQAWSSPDGSMGSAPIHGLYLSDVRIVSALGITIGGRAGEPIATVPDGADAVAFVALARHLDDRAPDPRVRSTHRRRVTIDGASETIRLQSTLNEPIHTTVLERSTPH